MAPQSFTVAVLALLLTELKFDWLERGVGATLVSTNAERPESGAIWEKGHKTQAARTTVERLATDREAYQRMARNAGSLNEIVGTLAPGHSPGTLTVDGNTTWNGGATYLWEINDANGAAGSAYDLVSIFGTLTLAATPESKFKLSLASLTAGNEAGTLAGFDAAQDYTYTIASASGGILGFDAGKFTIDSSGFTNALAGGLWSLAVTGNDLTLNFAAASAVPEPSTYAALAGLGALGLALYRRRR
jgi:hypothetical protein